MGSVVFPRRFIEPIGRCTLEKTGFDGRDHMGNGFGHLGKIYPKGERIWRQGDPGDEMFIIHSGAVEVSSRHDGILAEKGNRLIGRCVRLLVPFMNCATH